jgi:hypothetical protein
VLEFIIIGSPKLSYRVEVQNVKTPHNEALIKSISCRNLFCIPVFIIPGIEVPFRGLGLKHDYGHSK